jgi:uncharacterized protein (TIGR03083 family)
MDPQLSAPSVTRLAAALAAAGSRFAAMLRRVGDPSLPAVGEWNVGETAAHCAGSASFFLSLARGRVEPERIDEVAANNAAYLVENRERDPRILADQFAAGERALLDHVAGVDGDPLLEAFRGIPAPLSTLLAVELGEVLVHGFDIARASGLPWEMRRDEAALTIDGLAPLLPHYLRRQAAAAFRARVELRPRGGIPRVLVFADGELHLRAIDRSPVDCHLSVDPVAYLLLAYGRIGQLRPMLQGKLLAWGRRPWLAARLPALFRAP